MVLRSLLGADMMFRPDREKEKESEKPARLRKREKTTCLRGRTQLYSLAEALRSAAMEGKAVAMTGGETPSAFDHSFLVQGTYSSGRERRGRGKG